MELKKPPTGKFSSFPWPMGTLEVVTCSGGHERRRNRVCWYCDSGWSQGLPQWVCKHQCYHSVSGSQHWLPDWPKTLFRGSTTNKRVWRLISLPWTEQKLMRGKAILSNILWKMKWRSFLLPLQISPIVSALNFFRTFPPSIAPTAIWNPATDNDSFNLFSERRWYDPHEWKWIGIVWCSRWENRSSILRTVAWTKFGSWTAK